MKETVNSRTTEFLKQDSLHSVVLREENRMNMIGGRQEIHHNTIHFERSSIHTTRLKN